MAAPPAPERPPTNAAGRTPAQRWLLFVHQLPSSPSNLRVRTWRRLQQLGAIPVKQAVYVLPDSPAAREDFEWLRAEVKGVGGDASVFLAAHLESWSDDALVEEFRRTRQEAYTALAGEIERSLRQAGAARKRRGDRRPALGRLLEGFRQRQSALEHIDFFGSAGRDRVALLLAQFEEKATGRLTRAGPVGAAGAEVDLSAYTGRLWVTRPRPGVDRMSSAWLIRRFIDPRARFGFAADREALPPDAVPFDMFGVEFSHRGDGCTFETLCDAFGVGDPAIERIGQLVHDLDLKDGRFGAADAPTVGALIDGYQLATGDDAALLEQGISMFESLYLAYLRAATPLRPRKVATPRRSPASAARRTSRHR
jgi:hypothetical protein